MTIDEILAQPKAEDVIKSLKVKTVTVPKWEALEAEYNPNLHPIVKDATLRPKDKVKGGFTEKVAKLTYAAEKIAVRRMNQMAFTLPVERNYKYDEGNATLKEIADAIEGVYSVARIDSVNIDRMRAYFAACEMCTIWYAVETIEEHEDYGFATKFKLRCRSYSPMNPLMSHISQAELYPLFDEYDDMIAMSIEYVRKEKGEDVTYFECYTSTNVYKWRSIGGKVEEPIITPVTIGKIQCIYLNRSAPIFDGIANNRSEIEFSLSRTSDIVRKNSAPIVKIVGNMADKNDKPASDIAREVYHLEAGGDIGTEAPPVSTESTAYLVNEMRRNIEEETQLPNLSMENIKGLGAISGEARKTLLTDAHLKVGEEKHPIVWFFDREFKVIKALLAQANTAWKENLKLVTAKHIITPFIQGDKKAKSDRLNSEVASKTRSRKSAIIERGDILDIDAELKQINDESIADFGEPTMG